MYSTQLTDYHHYDVQNLIFQRPDRHHSDRLQRVRIMTHHLDGTRGDLILSTPRLLSYGLQEQFDPVGKQLVGYQLPLVMWGRKGPSEEETQFIKAMHDITEVCKDFLVENREEFDKPHLTKNELHRLNPLYYKMEKGKIVEDRPPLLYAKLNVYRNENQVQIRTLFTDEITKETIDPTLLLNRRCFIYGAVRLESLLVGNKVSIQVKLFEARVRLLDSGFKSLLEPGMTFKKNSKTRLPNQHHHSASTSSGKSVEEENTATPTDEKKMAIESI